LAVGLFAELMRKEDAMFNQWNSMMNGLLQLAWLIVPCWAADQHLSCVRLTTMQMCAMSATVSTASDRDCRDASQRQMSERCMDGSTNCFACEQSATDASE
jgi:hypothetical protein